MSAPVVQVVGHPPNRAEEGGARPTPALYQLLMRPIPHRVARRAVERYHYLHSLPGGTSLAFGVFDAGRLVGVLTLGVGPTMAHRLVTGATTRDCLTLTRLWLSDELPKNSESHVLSVVLRALRRHTSLKFVLSYADPAHGHIGTIYQAAGWLYTGLSQGSSMCDLGDGRLRHTKTVGYLFGTYSSKHFEIAGAQLKLVPQPGKHRYLFFLEGTWRERLLVPVLPYPKKETSGYEGS